MTIRRLFVVQRRGLDERLRQVSRILHLPTQDWGCKSHLPHRLPSITLLTNTIHPAPCPRPTPPPALPQIVKPYQLWTPRHLTLFHISYYYLTLAWSSLLGVHLEEFLFWSWLLQVIRTQQSKSWFKSVYFKLWVVGCVGGVGLLFGAATMELDALTRVSRGG